MVFPRFSPVLRTFSTPAARVGSRNAVIRCPRQTAFARRFYASNGHQEKKSSEIPWLLGSVTVTVPAAVYLLNSEAPETRHAKSHHKPILKEEEKDEGKEEEEEEESSDAGESSNSSERDPPKATSSPESPEAESKQEGASNTETKHPDLDASPRTEKAEGETDTAKVKGPVSPERPKEEA